MSGYISLHKNMQAITKVSRQEESERLASKGESEALRFLDFIIYLVSNYQKPTASICCTCGNISVVNISFWTKGKREREREREIDR